MHTTTSAIQPLATLHLHSAGEDVRILQQRLNFWQSRFTPSGDHPLKVDGIFGLQTEQVVRSFQNSQLHLQVDSIVGSETWSALFRTTLPLIQWAFFIRPARVAFLPGTSSVLIKSRVARGDRDAYILRARAEQTMKLRITSFENAAAIYEVSDSIGSPLQRETDNDVELLMTTTDDYYVTVAGVRQSASYQLEIEII